MEVKVALIEESRRSHRGAQTSHQKGGWITIPFILGSMFFLGLSGSTTSNLVVYLMKGYNVRSIDAAETNNIILGCLSVAPVAGAIIADAFFGCYPVIVFSAFASLLSAILFTLTAALQSLRPTPCAIGSDACERPTVGQEAVLYSAVILLAVASGGYSFNMATMGADQFRTSKDKDVFFNWFFMVKYVSAIVCFTAFVYVQENVSWTLGFALAIVCGIIGTVALILGARHYRRFTPEGSPFTGLVRVIIAAIRKMDIATSPSESMHCYYADREDPKETSRNTPTQTLRFLNRAAVIYKGDVNPDGSISRPWRLCTVQQVEDMKALVSIFPLWSSSILLSVSIGIQMSLAILQALAMDRSLGPRFVIPAGSMSVSSLASFVLSLFAIDRVFAPLWRRLSGGRGRGQSPLQRIGLGHVINVIAMASSALVEMWREGIVREHGAEGFQEWVAPMSAMWLVLPFSLTGLAEALHFPGQVALYYQEFPRALRNTASGMMALIVALGFYLSTAVIGLIQSTTSWLPDNINASRMEKVYWMVTVMTAINFGYYVVCARLYKYRSSDNEGPLDDAADM